ncbi:dipeptidase PepV [Paucilactobacillus wasatchensis]|uniref:Acetylornithine deacetylase/Succinyl-diaminopimelate desuccinylase n=1 Tax=Paucilactobacillus wasatchensis TaxID=1335616 RepID=A0A0D1A9C6_9LACO|nr:dipeptidase PepV [Paucilactobacillus wasatchensis]KIS03346.1 Acetylornithine deacetylase/Succinyl-diaminopimelate desuccinylase [Paucilactobacillus wasatchensis]
MIDWKTKAKQQQEDYLNDLISLMKIQSVRDDTQATDEFPLGPKPAQALTIFLEMAQQDGFRTRNIDNVVGYAEWGEGEETLAILARLDVMPAGNSWDTDPFDPVIKNGNLYGRGASDDKGPGMAAYYALKTLKDMDVKFNKKVRFIVGTDEESDWTGMKRYFEVEPEPTFGFSPDAEFPLINGEKGNVSLKLDFEGGNDGSVQLKSFHSGLRPNMVPREAEAQVTSDDNASLVNAFTEFVAKQPVTGEAVAESDGVKLIIVGKAAHGMEPRNGENAGTYLASFLQTYDIKGAAGNFITLIGQYMHQDSRLHNFDLAFKDDVMGDLTMNVGLMNFDEQDGGQIDMNFRYPKGITPDEIQAKLAMVTTPKNVKVIQGAFMVPHYVDASDPLVVTLMDAYRHQTGDVDALPEVVGGGTYGRMMKRGVAFGALFAHTEDTMHQANEFQPVDDLIMAMSIYMESIFNLVTD